VYDIAMRMVAISVVILAGCTKHEATPVTRAPAEPASDDGAIALPRGAPGIGFDDLQYSARLGVLVPAGRAGDLDVIDPVTHAVRAIENFSAAAEFDGGHDVGVTSVADTGTFLAVTDRTSRELIVFEPDGDRMASVKLRAGPDYVRFAPATGELWVTEPDGEQIEVFQIMMKDLLVAGAPVSVPGGPESLVIDSSRNRAYTHLWDGATVAIELDHHRVLATWPNQCKGSRGIALDATRGWLLAGCAEGAVVVLDVLHDGAVLGKVAPPGLGRIDIIDYSPSLRHAYLSGTDGVIAIVGLDRAGAPTVLGTVPGAKGSHCITTDGAGALFACDPSNGRIIARTDPYPAQAD
jgi:hypothetical protein